MNAAEEIKKLKEVLKEIRGQGKEVVPIDGLVKYIEEIEVTGLIDINQQNIAQQKFENECEIAKLRTPHEVEMFKSVVEAGLNALKSALVINGGAAIALLAFVGNQITKSAASDQRFILTCFGYSLLVFIVGAGFAGVASGARYLAQFSYARALDNFSRGIKSSAWLKWGHGINILSIILGAASFVAFFVGGYFSYSALISYTGV